MKSSPLARASSTKSAGTPSYEHLFRVFVHFYLENCMHVKFRVLFDFVWPINFIIDIILIMY